MDGTRTDPKFRIVSHFVLHVMLRCLLLAVTLSTEATVVVVIAGTPRRNEFTVTAQYADRTADRGGGGKGTILGEDGAKDGEGKI